MSTTPRLDCTSGLYSSIQTHNKYTFTLYTTFAVQQSPFNLTIPVPKPIRNLFYHFYHICFKWREIIFQTARLNFSIMVQQAVMYCFSTYLYYLDVTLNQDILSWHHVVIHLKPSPVHVNANEQNTNPWHSTQKCSHHHYSMTICKKELACDHAFILALFCHLKWIPLEFCVLTLDSCCLVATIHTNPLLLSLSQLNLSWITALSYCACPVLSSANSLKCVCMRVCVHVCAI